MMYVDFTAGGKTYKLRLNTRQFILAEKQLGYNPVTPFLEEGTVPTVTCLVTLLHASLQAYEHGITLNDAYDLFDTWLAEGNSIIEFVSLAMELFKVSGLIRESKEEKN